MSSNQLENSDTASRIINNLKVENSEVAPAVQNDGTTVSEEAGSDNSGEYGGPKGLEPTRYGDWEKSGRCIDF